MEHARTLSRRAARGSPLAVALAVALGACSSTASSTAGGNGVDDVRRACETRTSWAHATSDDCIKCFAYATTPRCDCSDSPVAGKCSAQQQAKTNEPTCEGTVVCVSKCVATDCACIDACYAGKACRTFASAVDGCATAACDDRCR